MHPEKPNMPSPSRPSPNRTTSHLSPVAFLIAACAAACPDRALAQANFTWSNASNTTWLTTTNWSPSGPPGTLDIAEFATNPTGASVGINLGSTTNNGSNNEAVGAILVDPTRTANLAIGNSSTSVSGTLTLNGATVNSVANSILANLSSSATTLTVQNTQGSGNKTMTAQLGASFGPGVPAVIQAAPGTGVTVSSIIAEATNGTPITIQGGGTVTFSGANTYTGPT